jgi:hypothetical protein
MLIKFLDVQADIRKNQYSVWEVVIDDCAVLWANSFSEAAEYFRAEVIYHRGKYGLCQ